ncbi:hypothetical protein Tco_0437750 [Tanacetum coccineum]
MKEFLCAKPIVLETLLITHQGNSQVKDNKIDLLVQQYEQFTISEEESIDNAFARFNTIITSLKAPDEGYSSKNYARKFLKAVHPNGEQRCGDPIHLIGECLKPPRNKNQRALAGGSWSDNGEEEEKTKDETCLMAQASSEVLS